MTIDSDKSGNNEPLPIDVASQAAFILRITEGVDPEVALPDMKILPSCFNESDTLRSVVIGYVDNLYLHGRPQLINLMAAESASAGNEPTMEVSIPEFRNLQRVLEAEGVEVLTPDELGAETKVYNQSYSRDIGFVIGDKFFVSRMKKAARMQEWRSIAKYIATIPEANRVYVPEGMFIEGGDIVVDKGIVFVGISQRTTEEALAFLEEQLTGTGLKVVPVRTRSIEEGKDVLHLDCTFVPVGKNCALIYSDGIAEMPKEISDTYDLIEVTAEEQRELATNVLALSPTQVIARDSAHRVNSEMTNRGIEVIPVKFDDAPMFGGSIRCCTLPLVRQN